MFTAGRTAKRFKPVRLPLSHITKKAQVLSDNRDEIHGVEMTQVTRKFDIQDLSIFIILGSIIKKLLKKI